MSNEYFDITRVNSAAQAWFYNHTDSQYTVYATLIGNAVLGFGTPLSENWQNEFGSSSLPVTGYTRKSIVAVQHELINEPYDLNGTNDQTSRWGPAQDIVWENTTPGYYWPEIRGYALLSKDVDLASLPSDAARQTAWERYLIGYWDLSSASAYHKSLWPGDRVQITSSSPYTNDYLGDFGLSVGG